MLLRTWLGVLGYLSYTRLSRSYSDLSVIPGLSLSHSVLLVIPGLSQSYPNLSVTLGLSQSYSAFSVISGLTGYLMFWCKTLCYFAGILLGYIIETPVSGFVWKSQQVTSNSMKLPDQAGFDRKNYQGTKPTIHSLIAHKWRHFITIFNTPGNKS